MGNFACQWPWWQQLPPVLSQHFLELYGRENPFEGGWFEAGRFVFNPHPPEGISSHLPG